MWLFEMLAPLAEYAEIYQAQTTKILIKQQKMYHNISIKYGFSTRLPLSFFLNPSLLHLNLHRVSCTLLEELHPTPLEMLL